MKENERNKHICEEMQKNIKYWTYAESKTDKNIKIEDYKFISAYEKLAKIKFLGDSFFNEEGIVDNLTIKQNIQKIISKLVKQNLDSKVNSLFNSLVKKCYSKSEIKIDEIHTLNNKLIITKDGIIEKDRDITATRLNVNYNKEAGIPTNFLQFLNGLLEPKDIVVLQEYMGYCLYKKNNAQKGLFILGKGGEGKSLLGKIFCDILGDTVLDGDSLVDMLGKQFGLGNLINKLVIYDDELSELELKDSATFKKLISGGKINSEKKYKDPISVESCCKIFACGNHMLKAKTKDTHAFKRRLLIMVTKDKEKNRKDDANYYNKLTKEKEAIFLWMLDGLYRFLNQKKHFSFEEEMAEKVEMLISSNDDCDLILKFLNDENYIKLGTNKKELSQSIYKAYIIWAIENDEKLIEKNLFMTSLGKIHKSCNLEDAIIYEKGKIGDKNKLRGYKNLEILKKEYIIA